MSTGRLGNKPDGHLQLAAKDIGGEKLAFYSREAALMNGGEREREWRTAKERPMTTRRRRRPETLGLVLVQPGVKWGRGGVLAKGVGSSRGRKVERKASFHGDYHCEKKETAKRERRRENADRLIDAARLSESST